MMLPKGSKEILPQRRRNSPFLVESKGETFVGYTIALPSSSVVSAPETTKGKDNALDHFRHTARPLAAWDGQFLHDGRFHSHIARDRHCRRPDQRDFGQTLRLTECLEARRDVSACRAIRFFLAIIPVFCVKQSELSVWSISGFRVEAKLI